MLGCAFDHDALGDMSGERELHIKRERRLHRDNAGVGALGWGLREQRVSTGRNLFKPETARGFGKSRRNRGPELIEQRHHRARECLAVWTDHDAADRRTTPIR